MSFDSGTPLAGAELIDPDRYARDGYPFETWDRLRRESPVLRYEGPDYPSGRSRDTRTSSRPRASPRSSRTSRASRS